MSHLEEIEKLKEEACQNYPDPCTSPPCVKELSLIDRAFSLGGKFVRDRVEEAYKLHSKTCCSTEETHDGAGCLDAASQALSELESKAIQLGVMEKDV